MNIHKFRKDLDAVGDKLQNYEIVLKAGKGASLSIIFNNKTDSNQGISLDYTQNSLRITEFTRDPYRTRQVMDIWNLSPAKRTEVQALIAKVVGDAYYV